MAAIVAASLLAACSGGGQTQTSAGLVPNTPALTQPGKKAALTGYDMYSYAYYGPAASCDPDVSVQNGYVGFGFWTVTVGASLGTLIDNGDGSAEFDRTGSGTVTVKWHGNYAAYTNVDTCAIKPSSQMETWDVP